MSSSSSILKYIHFFLIILTKSISFCVLGSMDLLLMPISNSNISFYLNWVGVIDSSSIFSPSSSLFSSFFWLYILSIIFDSELAEECIGITMMCVFLLRLCTFFQVKRALRSWKWKEIKVVESKYSWYFKEVVFRNYP